MEQILELTTNEWLETLAAFQQDLVKQLLQNHSEEEAIAIWIEVSGPEYTTAFGGDGGKNFLKRFKDEFDSFIIGKDSYNKENDELKRYGTVTKFFIVSFLSNCLSQHMGIAGSVIAPLVVLSLGIIGKMGLNAYRKSVIEKNNKEGNQE